MAEQKILISININDKQAKKSADGVAQSLTKVQKAQEALNFELSEAGREYAKLTAATNDQKLANNLAAKSAVDMAKGIKQGRTQSGLNNAILLETGRLASDASYGFTAIANNLSQVVTLFSSFVKTNDGVTQSFKELGKSLIGSGGFLIAIQLLISFGPQIFAFFKRLLGFTTELQDAFKGASKTVTDSAGSFETYTKTLQDSTKSQEEQNDAVKALNKEFPNYVKQLNDAGLTLGDLSKGTEEAVKMTDAYRESIIKQAIARQAQIKIDEAAGKIIDLKIEEEMYQFDNAEKFKTDTLRVQTLERAHLREVEEYGEDSAVAKKAKKKYEQFKKALEQDKNFNAEKIKEQREYINKLIKFTDIQDDAGPGGGGGGKAKVRFRNLRSARTDYDKFIEKARKKDLKDEQLTAFEKLELQKQLALDELDIQQQKFVEKEKQRRDDYIKDLQLQKDSKLEQAKSEAEKKTITIEFERAKQDAIAKTAQAMQQSAESFSNAAIRIGDSYDNIINRFLEEEELQDLAGFGKALQKGNEDRLAAQESFLSSYTDSEIDRVGVAKEIEANRFSSEMANLNSIRDARIAEGQSTLEIDQQILNAEASNSEAKIALAEAEKDAKIGIANQVGNAIVAVAGEGSTVGKAASIAMAIMNTKEAFTSALGAKPYGPWNIAQAAATLAMGLKQVKDIMAVKIPGKEPASGGLGGGNVIQAPDFNVVGASQTSQLAETVAEQQAKPVKAFVVGKDISTQQELDRNITNTASFG
jgi:hypothetical protein